MGYNLKYLLLTFCKIILDNCSRHFWPILHQQKASQTGQQLQYQRTITDSMLQSWLLRSCKDSCFQSGSIVYAWDSINLEGEDVNQVSLHKEIDISTYSYQRKIRYMYGYRNRFVLRIYPCSLKKKFNNIIHCYILPKVRDATGQTVLQQYKVL